MVVQALTTAQIDMKMSLFKMGPTYPYCHTFRIAFKSYFIGPEILISKLKSVLEGLISLDPSGTRSGSIIFLLQVID